MLYIDPQVFSKFNTKGEVKSVLYVVVVEEDEDDEEEEEEGYGKEAVEEVDLNRVRNPGQGPGAG
ncbi:hypothetical protein EMCG_05286 [[Emmonsia] crescens]|uniref:Uncharacterized protein n=1 Tax=[Emmonsia] crescens TaxID=73230 RepID=A0A0G2HQI7_9EURO|nr:hypothetical protein EMCG_05286 [Emmonsia crescens UAMH 3008]